VSESSIGRRIEPETLDHPAGQTHIWLWEVTEGTVRATCGLVAARAELTEPEDEYGMHDECLLRLGDLVADELPPGMEWRASP
jgi:hypothetical protein